MLLEIVRTIEGKRHDNKLAPGHGLDLLVELIYIKIFIYLNI